MKIPLVGLLAACVLGGTVQAQLTTAGKGGKTAKEKGEDCYHGRCEDEGDGGGGPGVDDLNIQTGDEECDDCSKLTASALLCYTCCSDNGCTDVALTWCQDFCIGLGSPWSGFPDWADEDREIMLESIPAVITAMVDRVSAGQDLDQADLDWIDGALAITYRSGDTQTASWLMALLLDAYATDQIDADDPAKLWRMVGEVHSYALLETRDDRFHRMGLKLVGERGLLGDVPNRGQVFVSLIVEAASQPAGEVDPVLVGAIRNF